MQQPQIRVMLARTIGVLCYVSVNSKDKSDNKDKSVLVGPTYKIEVTIEGVCTRALLEHGAQVNIVGRQLCGKIKEKLK